jgi:hypothetical protein
MLPITLPTPIPDPKSGHLIQLQLEDFHMDRTGDLTLKIRLIHFTNEDGNFGIPLRDSIMLDPNLSDLQKSRQTKHWEDQFTTVTTKDVQVDQTGEVVFRDEHGNYPEGSFAEKYLWQSVLKADVPGDTVAETVFALIIQSMGQMVERNRI